jgi:lipopolysaccharide transport protein LptA
MVNSLHRSIARATRRAALGSLVAAALLAALDARAESPPPAVKPAGNVVANPLLAPGQSELPITVDARSSEFDYGKSRLVFHNVTITQGKLRVEAGEATATNLNFENSQWQFVGAVRITMENGSLNSDRADVTFAANQIARAVINGSPATFEQTLEQPPQVARGHANVIEYDVAQGTVRLSDDAWLSDGENELSGAVLVYDIRAERVLANAPAGTDQRVRITINPQKRKPATPAPDTTK